MSATGEVVRLTLALLFCALSMVANASEADEAPARVTGIGGVFFLAEQDNKSLHAWYEKHLGIPIQEWGGGLLLWEDDEGPDGGATVWHVARPDSKWFAPSKSRFMINYRVNDLVRLIEQLQAEGIEILQGPETHENGLFAWLMDPEGNKIELWEPRLMTEPGDG